MVQSCTHFKDSEMLCRVSEKLGGAMVGINCDTLESKELMQTRGW